MADRRKPPTRRRADPARLAAYDVLEAVRADDAYTNLVLPAVLRRHELTGRDAAFATELAAGTLRRRGTYDAVLAACVDRPLARVEPGVLDALRLGVHQLLSMRVPPHAAISTTVDLVHVKVGRGPAGFTNAVLRKAAQHDLSGWVRRVAPDPSTDPTGFAAVAHSHPRWIVEQLTAAVGEEEVDDLLAADNLAPRVVLVARPGRAEVDELPGTRTRFSPYGVVMEGGDPASVPAVAEGRAGVQDEGSQLVALALSRASIEGRDERWLDLCAGPGGKAALLAGLAAGQGARLLAAELRPHRATLVARALAGADGSLGTVAVDGTRPAWPPGASTGSWSTPPARVSVPCAAGRRPGGGAPPMTSTTWCRSRSGCSTARSTASGRAGWSSTPPAPRCWPRPRAWSARSSSGATTSSSGTRQRCCRRSRTRPDPWPAPSSCGHTGTRRMPCSSPFWAEPPDIALGFSFC